MNETLINFQKNCTTCKLTKTQPKLIDELYNTKFYNPRSDVSVASVARKYNLSKDSVSNHIKKHQYLSDEDKKQAIERTIAENAKDAVIKQLVTHNDIRKEIMTKGLSQIKAGKIKLTAKDVIAASRDQMTYEMKTQSNQLKMMEMMWHFASGESNESTNYDRAIIEGETATSFDPAKELTRDN
jgi:predicted DNA-binding protein YlxM (UPF0122 family)